MVVFLGVFIFLSGYNWQVRYDHCKETNFKSANCEAPKKASELGKRDE